MCLSHAVLNNWIRPVRHLDKNLKEIIEHSLRLKSCSSRIDSIMGRDTYTQSLCVCYFALIVSLNKNRKRDDEILLLADGAAVGRPARTVAAGATEWYAVARLWIGWLSERNRRAQQFHFILYTLHTSYIVFEQRFRCEIWRAWCSLAKGERDRKILFTITVCISLCTT